MTQYRDPDAEAVALITAHIGKMLDESIKNEVALSNNILVATICHLYENKDFIKQEAGMGAPVASKIDLDIQIICDKIDKIRTFAWNGDTDPHAGLNLAEACAPFFREYGVKIKKLLKGEA